MSSALPASSFLCLLSCEAVEHLLPSYAALGAPIPEADWTLIDVEAAGALIWTFQTSELCVADETQGFIQRFPNLWTTNKVYNTIHGLSQCRWIHLEIHRISIKVNGY